MSNNKTSDWKKKWKNVPINPQNIDEYLKDLINNTNSEYITQSVSFNKHDPYQIGLYKQAVLTHGTFSGFIKHLLGIYFSQQKTHMYSPNQFYQPMNPTAYRPVEAPAPTFTPPVMQETFYQQVAPTNEQSISFQPTATKAVETEMVEDKSESETIQKASLPESPKIDTSIKPEVIKTNIGEKSRRKNANAKANPFLQPNPNAKPSTNL